VVTHVSAAEVVVDGVRYGLRPPAEEPPLDEGTLIWPLMTAWHEPVVRPGDSVAPRALLARGVTRIYFQANIKVFTALVFAAAIFMGVGMAAVYKHIPTYFPGDVGTVGGLVGVLGGLGGFVGPILFGYLLEWSGIWTTSWMVLWALAVASLLWMHLVIRRMTRVRTAEIATHIEERGTPIPLPLRVWCPVHAVEAVVRIVVMAEASPPQLRSCSLFPDRDDAPPCEGRCVVAGESVGAAPRPGEPAAKP
jgi:NNP family nitrate/nitrite transporter-like MFS transporter